MAGEMTQNSIDLTAKAMSTMAVRSRVQEPFTPDLKGAIEPLATAVETLTETFKKTASAQLEIASEAARMASDEALAAVGAPDLLNAAIAVGQVPAGGHAFQTTTIERRSGARGIPWLEFIKEVIELIVGLIPGVGRLVGIISEVLKLLDKIFGGQDHTKD